MSCHYNSVLLLPTADVSHYSMGPGLHLIGVSYVVLDAKSHSSQMGWRGGREWSRICVQEAISLVWYP